MGHRASIQWIVKPRLPPEPGHLAFGKLVDVYFQLAEHFIIGQLANDVKCQILVFQSVVNEVGIQGSRRLYHK